MITLPGNNTNLTPVICLSIVLIVTCIVYWPGLNGPLLLDDIPNLFHIDRFGNGIISWKQVFILTPHGTTRPVSIISFMMNWIISGKNIWGLKFTNLAIHLVCGVLIYRLSWLLLNYGVIKNRETARYTALWITALWLLSPFLLSTVLYVIQRMTQLSALFTLCGMLSYVTGRINYENEERLYSGPIIASFILFWPLATLSKQNGVLLPLLIFITEIFFFNKDTYKPEIKKLRTILAALLVIPGVVVMITGFISPGWVLEGYGGRDFTLFERLITQPRVLLDYIGNLLLVPGVTPMGLFHDDYVKSTGILAPVSTLAGLVFLIIILIGAYKTRTRIISIVFYGFVFFYAAHLVESSFIPLELYFEHRNYLPAFGIYFSVVTGMSLLLQHIKYKYIAVIVLLIAPLVFSVLTYQRSLIWQKKTSIYFLSDIYHPDSPRLNEGLAFIHLLNKNPDQALFHLDKVIILKKKQLPPAFYFKYLLAYCYGERSMSEDEFKNKIKIVSLSNNLATVTYFGKFIESVQKGRCNSLDLNRIADNFIIAVNNRNQHYDKDKISYVHILLSDLLNYLGRNDEADRMRNLANLINKK